jgi:TctA family transporter
VPILQGLTGLPQTVGALRNDLSSACSTINAMRPAKFTIPAVEIDLPGTLGTVKTFPGFSHTLFPGIAPAC